MRLLTAGEFKPILGGKADRGFVEPTIPEVSCDAKMARKVIFGPGLSVLTADSFDGAISFAGASEYGLGASTFFSSVKRDRLGGRDNGIHVQDRYSQVKTIRVDLADDADEAVA
jgi:4-(gamma-glutamylamino)butanal dehydrogenase